MRNRTIRSRTPEFLKTAFTAIAVSGFLAACGNGDKSSGPSDIGDAGIISSESLEIASSSSSSRNDEKGSCKDEEVSRKDEEVSRNDEEGSRKDEDVSSKDEEGTHSNQPLSSGVAETMSSSSITGPELGSSATVPGSSSTVPSSSSESPYLWNDEFDIIDTAKWSFETGASGWGNNEWQYYTARPENAYVKDGILHIRANKENYEGASYTSARLITKGKFSFTYGTVEARIALPTGQGIWPAFWTLGENIDEVSWPACGEIDIIEAVNSENIVYGTNHWQHQGNQADYGNNTADFYGASKELDITQFHTYKMVWDEKVIAMYVDDFKYHEIAIENSDGEMEEFHQPHFFLLNVAVAGNWPGFEVDDSQFPNEMLVDYIRVSP